MNPDTVLDIATAPKRNSRHWKQTVITWGEIIGWLASPADHKECGGYVLGRLAPCPCSESKCGCERPGCGHHERSKTSVLERCVLTLDADTANLDLIDQLELVVPWASVAHTTYSSTSDALRLRVLIPLSRSVAPDEYHEIARVVMAQLGQEYFDPGSAQPERYMYRPSEQRPGLFQSWVQDGEPADVDGLLVDFDPDLSRLPGPSTRSKRDPFEIEGVVGAFNRAFSIQEAIVEYELPYRQIDSLRWQLVGARAEAGLNTVADGLVFSHHVTDPAWGKTCSAFDLVRVHRFGQLDENQAAQTPINRLPSYKAMLELASLSSKVVAQLVGVDFTAELDEMAEEVSWKLKLRLHNRTGRFIDCIENWDLVRTHEPVFQHLQFNELTMAVETTEDLPWRPLANGGSVFNATDRAALCHYLEREYKIRPPRGLMDEIINTTAQQHYVNPLRDYLLSLEWDGTRRLETCLPGVVPTKYTRMVARKAMVAAAARVLQPGIKWDHTLILAGDEGLGKSYWVEKVARGYSASLGRIGDKDTFLTMQRSWIMLSDEGHSLKKADADVQKEFLTRTEDVYRIPYEREATAHKRHCVIWGSTNDEVFLRRQQGNRRFLIVQCEQRVDFGALTDEYIDQLWAEAVALFQAGEQLFLDERQSSIAKLERERFIEEDALAGVLEAYLDTLVPPDWDDMSSEARVVWLRNRQDDMVPPGTEPIMRTCSAQLWVEALGRRFGDHHRADLLDISTAMKRIPGWRQLDGRHRIASYGPQLVYERVPDEELL